jgi:hypothetical protein
VSEADVNGTARLASLPRTDHATPSSADPTTPPALAPETPPSASLPPCERYRTRQDAAAYLSEKLGRTITVGALHRHASDETGPRYVMILGRASYRTDWLDAWVDSLVQPPAERRRRRANPEAEHVTPAAEPGTGTPARRTRRSSTHAA